MSTPVFAASDNTDQVTVRRFDGFGGVYGLFVGNADTEWRDHSYVALSVAEVKDLIAALTQSLGDNA